MIFCVMDIFIQMFFTYYFFIFIIFSVPDRSFFKGLCCVPYTFPLQFHVGLGTVKFKQISLMRIAAVRLQFVTYFIP